MYIINTISDTSYGSIDHNVSIYINRTIISELVGEYDIIARQIDHVYNNIPSYYITQANDLSLVSHTYDIDAILKSIIDTYCSNYGYYSNIQFSNHSKDIITYIMYQIQEYEKINHIFEAYTGSYIGLEQCAHNIMQAINHISIKDRVYEHNLNIFNKRYVITSRYTKLYHHHFDILEMVYDHYNN